MPAAMLAARHSRPARMLCPTESGRPLGRDPMTEIALAELARYMKPVILATDRAPIRARK